MNNEIKVVQTFLQYGTNRKRLQGVITRINLQTKSRNSYSLIIVPVSSHLQNKPQRKRKWCSQMAVSFKQCRVDIHHVHAHGEMNPASRYTWTVCQLYPRDCIYHSQCTSHISTIHIHLTHAATQEQPLCCKSQNQKSIPINPKTTQAEANSNGDLAGTRRS